MLGPAAMGCPTGSLAQQRALCRQITTLPHKQHNISQCYTIQVQARRSQVQRLNSLSNSHPSVTPGITSAAALQLNTALEPQLTSVACSVLRSSGAAHSPPHGHPQQRPDGRGHHQTVAGESAATSTCCGPHDSSCLTGRPLQECQLSVYKPNPRQYTAVISQVSLQYGHAQR